MNLTMHQIRVLNAVATHGSFTGAAAALHLTQPAVSRVISQAERTLGTPIFVRTTRTLSMTTRGRMILPVARAIVDEFDRGSALLMDAAKGEPELLRIAALPSVTSSILPSALTALRSKSPRTRIHIVSSDASAIATLVREGAVDVAVTVEDDISSEAAFTPVLDDEFVCLFPHDHAFTQVNRLTWMRVADEPLIALSTSSSVRRRADQGFESAGASPISVTETTDMPTAAALVAAGLGVTVATRLLLPLISFADLKHTRIVDPPVSRRVGVVVVRPEARTVAIEALVAALRAEGRGLSRQ